MIRVAKQVALRSTGLMNEATSRFNLLSCGSKAGRPGMGLSRSNRSRLREVSVNKLVTSSLSGM